MAISVQSSPGFLPGDESALLSELEWSVLLTVLYADIFDFAPREDELYDRLILCGTDRPSVRRALDALSGRFITRTGGHITLRGREHLVDVRRRRDVASERLWSAAQRYARWLSRVPFVRMVAVSGSVAVGNSEQNGDIDVFCIVESNRLWVARLFIVPLSKTTRVFNSIFPSYFCPNYLVTSDALVVEDRNLFTAHEVVQAVPIWGRRAYEAFLRSNTWVSYYLPHASPPPLALDEPVRPLVTRWCEWVLSGSLGHAIDELAYRAFVSFYRRRARRKGWSWSILTRAYRRDRYTVPEGGYVSVVRRLFFERLQDRLDLPAAHAAVDRLFPESEDAGRNGCYDWEGMFKKDYGPSAFDEVEA